MGCLFALFAGVFPRLALFIIWVARPVLVDAAFGSWLVPLAGIIFLPFATLIYVVLYTPGSFEMIEHRYEHEDLKQISNWWQERMRCAVQELPSKWVESAFSRLAERDRETPSP